MLLLTLCSTIAHAAKNEPVAPPGGGVFGHQAALGNIFTTGERVRIPCGAGGNWTVTDFLGKQVDAGTAMGGTIEPKVAETGFYMLHLGNEETSFSIVPAADPARYADSHFGVNLLLGQTTPPEVIGLMAKAGITQIRDVVAWQQLEHEPGVYDFANAGKGRLASNMAALAGAHMQSLGVMGLGNKLYTGAGQPWKSVPKDQRAYDAYARYCAAVLDKYHGQINAAEIWNEYNGGFCDVPAPQRPQHYYEMCKAAYTQIKARYPGVPVLGAASVGGHTPLTYIEGIFRLGGLNYMDGVVIHPYRATPEGIEDELGKLNDVITKYNHGKPKPIWATEVGSWWEITPEGGPQSSYMVRLCTLMLTSPAMGKIYWFMGCDDQTFPRMSLVHTAKDPWGPFTPSMMYNTYANLIRQFEKAVYSGREQMDVRTRAYRFDRGNETLWVCWSAFEDCEISFRTSQPVHIVNMVGGDRIQASDGGQVRVSIGLYPVFVVAPKGAVTAATEIPRPEKVLADSVSGFGTAQGGNGWSYGYAANNSNGTAPYAANAFTPLNLEAATGDQEDKWVNVKPLMLKENDASPGANGNQQLWAVRRWTSNVDGPVRIAARMIHGGKGPVDTYKLFVNGTELASKDLPLKSTQLVSTKTTLKRGDIVDFVITPGQGTDVEKANVGFRAFILAPAGQ